MKINIPKPITEIGGLLQKVDDLKKEYKKEKNPLFFSKT